MKKVIVNSWFLSSSMIVFGLLKFVDPFKTWYQVQIVKSQLWDFSYYLGIVGEILSGLILMLTIVFLKRQRQIFLLAMMLSLGTICSIMITSIYVHLHPDVPAEVLPLKIKPPYIPGFFLILAIANLFFIKSKEVFLDGSEN